jgi:hypothetical protein
MVARGDEVLAHAYGQITRLDEQIARADEQLSKLEHDATPSNGASVTRIITFRRGALGPRLASGRYAAWVSLPSLCSRSAAAVRPGQIIASRASSLV